MNFNPEHYRIKVKHEGSTVSNKLFLQVEKSSDIFNQQFNIQPFK
ncbi:hypothetical protein ABIC74_004106 [Mucilaginibacter rubeus]